MSVLGWVIQKKQKNTVSILINVGRCSHVWENERYNAGITASDTALAKTTGVSITSTVSGAGSPSSSSDSIANINTDSMGSFRRINFTNLEAGETYNFTVSDDCGANHKSAIAGSFKTLPDGAVSKGYGSCISSINDLTMWPDEGDYGSYLPSVRTLLDLGVDYFSYIDDFNYTGFAGQVLGMAPPTWMPPRHSGQEVWESATIYPSGGWNPHNTADPDAVNATDDAYYIYAYMKMCFFNPAFQALGQVASVSITAGDHDVMPGNDWDHFDGNTYSTGHGVISTGQHGVDEWRNVEIWDAVFGKDGNPDTNSSAPTTPVYPWGLLNAVDRGDGSPATGVPTTDYTDFDPDLYRPRHFAIESDFVLDVHPECMTSRSPKESEELAGATLLGATQYTDTVAAIAAADKGQSNEKPYIVISTPKQLYHGLVNNADGYMAHPSYSSGSTKPTAQAERDNLVAAMKSADKAIISFAGDSHKLFGTIEDGTIAELNIAGMSRANRAVGDIHQLTGTGSARLDDLYGNTEIGALKNGQFAFDYSDGVAYETDPYDAGLGTTSYADGFGWSTFQDDMSYHCCIDSRGYVVGGIMAVAPYSKLIQPALTSITGEVFSTMFPIEFSATPALADTGATMLFGIGASHVGTLITANPNKIRIGEEDANNRYFASIKGIYLTGAGKGGALSVSFHASETNVNDGSAMTTSGDADTVDNWPTGLEVIVSELDGSNPLTFSLATLPSTSPFASTPNDSRRWLLQDAYGDNPLGWTGRHSGGNDETALTFALEAGDSIPDDAMVGYTVYNTTDDSEGTVTGNTTSGSTVTVVAALTGGTDADWDANDLFIIPKEGDGELLFRINFPVATEVQVDQTTLSLAQGGNTYAEDGTYIGHWMDPANPDTNRIGFSSVTVSGGQVTAFAGSATGEYTGIEGTLTLHDDAAQEVAAIDTATFTEV